MQLKRLLRLFLPVLLIAAVLFGCLALGYDTVIRLNDNSEQQAKFQVGIVGTAGDTYLELGLMALETLDSTRFAVEIAAMEEDAAIKAMQRGDIAAFVVIPEGFVDAAMRGEIKQLKYVSTSGAVGLVSMFKDEITRVIERILVESQKGIYGAGSAMNAAGYDSAQVVNDISIEYVEFVFDRSKVYSIHELGISDELGLGGYLLCGFSIVLLMLICLPFAPMMIRRDLSLDRVLAARGRPVLAQVLCDFCVYLLGISAMVFVLLLYVLCSGWEGLTAGAALQGIPVILMIGAMSFFLYEMTSNLISGVLLQFFSALVLCYISGCLYPITFFPEVIQRLAGVLPSGLARMQLAGSITGSPSVTTAVGLLGYACLFFTAAALIRKRRVSGVRG